MYIIVNLNGSNIRKKEQSNEVNILEKFYFTREKRAH